jgi:phosphoribosylformylglycinamidine (FGAM) synthase-like amidotransferase family enzyme
MTTLVFENGQKVPKKGIEDVKAQKNLNGFLHDKSELEHMSIQNFKILIPSGGFSATDNIILQKSDGFILQKNFFFLSFL